MRAAQGPRALPALALASFLESSLLPVPIDLVMLPIVLSRRHAFWKIVGIGAAASLAGAVLAFGLGALAMNLAGDRILAFYTDPEDIRTFEAAYHRWGWLIILAAGITAIPFKVVALLCGAASMRLDVFLLTVIVVRTLRFAMIAGTIRLLGPPIASVIERHAGWFVGAAIALIILAGLAATALPDFHFPDHLQVPAY